MARFCVFGDSIAKGVVYDREKEKYVFSKDCCADRFSRETGSDVKNYSRFGSNILRGREMLEKHVAEVGDYNRVVLEFGGNDCDFHWDQIAENPDAEHLPNVLLDTFETQYGEVINDIRKNGGTPVLLTLPPLQSTRFFKWISRGLNAENILRWLGGDAWFTYRWQEMYNLAICRLAVEKNVSLVDIREAFLGKIHYENYLCEDGMHPNNRGHELIAETLCRRWKQAAL